MKERTDLKIKGHSDKEELSGEYIYGDLGQVVLFIIFLVVWITDSFFLNYSTGFSHLIPFYLRLTVSVAILIIAIFLARKSLNIVFGGAQTHTEIIREGPFSKVRHPIYLSTILFYMALNLFSISVISFIIWIVIILFYHFIARYEEKILIQRFGDMYRQYMDEVPMWIPRLW